MAWWMVLAAHAGPVDADRLDALLATAAVNETETLIVWQDGEILASVGAGDAGDWPVLEVMSVTKSVVSLAVGILVDQGTLELDAPVSTWLRDWPTGDDVTLRMLLNHSSGLAPGRTLLVARSKNVVRRAQIARLSGTPDETWRYNNRATNLIPEIVHQASGERIQDVVERYVFGPLDVPLYGWTSDAEGHAWGMAGLRLTAPQMLRLGQLMLNEGAWEGQQLVSADYVAEATQPSGPNPSCGLLWWPLHEQTDRAAMWKNELPELDELGAQRGYSAIGLFGQFIIVVPEEELIVVRQRTNGPLTDELSWVSLEQDALALVTP
jgi:CubicO group peptidase (beta-lactamase class C family)